MPQAGRVIQIIGVSRALVDARSVFWRRPNASDQDVVGDYDEISYFLNFPVFSVHFSREWILNPDRSISNGNYGGNLTN